MDFEFLLGAAVTLVAFGSLLLLDRFTDANQPGDSVFAPEQPPGWAEAMHVSRLIHGANLAPMGPPTPLHPRVGERAHSPAAAVQPMAARTWEKRIMEPRPSLQPSPSQGERIAAAA